MKIEKITLMVATEDYGMKHGMSALDYIIPALTYDHTKSIESECTILSYESEDYKLVPKTNCNGHQETDAEYETRVAKLKAVGKPCNCGSEVN